MLEYEATYTTDWHDHVRQKKNKKKSNCCCNSNDNKSTPTFCKTAMTSSWCLQYGAYVFFISSASATNVEPVQISYLVSWYFQPSPENTSVVTEGYIRAKNNVQSVSYLLCMQVINDKHIFLSKIWRGGIYSKEDIKTGADTWLKYGAAVVLGYSAMLSCRRQSSDRTALPSCVGCSKHLKH